MTEEEILCVLFMPCTHGKNLKHRVLSAFFRVFAPVSLAYFHSFKSFKFTRFS